MVLKVISALLIFLTLSFGVFFWVEAFQPPSQPPPGGNTTVVPVNEGSDAQIKAGALEIGGALTALGFCLNGQCVTAWPQTLSF